jgi:hypothetical protein
MFKERNASSGSASNRTADTKLLELLSKSAEMSVSRVDFVATSTPMKPLSFHRLSRSFSMNWSPFTGGLQLGRLGANR